ncbi:permease prefix domain 2-containing transporter [Salmonirosea aquatica]|uniref:Uncharacterized protein n=1 Tax=Salmonirosea aquatica TaxID=2654236 RepID=A0A7C9FZQ0_9BACT|nr:hypothetical protein [Cytophagaceae bacterium SJW1-29]
MRPHPPRMADRQPEGLVAPQLLESLLGELHEEFDYQVGRVGKKRARWRHWRGCWAFSGPASSADPSLFIHFQTRPIGYAII